MKKNEGDLEKLNWSEMWGDRILDMLDNANC